ncbi:MAG: AAA family ATPase [Saprospiraceae bacterium]|nr:AAA family ATPase [Saprospiraceae bacterium]
MAYNITIPFYAFKLHFHSGPAFFIPLNDAGTLRMGQPLHLMAGAYAELLQRKVLDRGELEKLMQEMVNGDFLKGAIRVPFAEAKDKISYPAFSLEFDYFYNVQENGILGRIPSLYLDAYAERVEELEKRLTESVKLEFARHNRLSDVRLMVAAIWNNTTELLQHEMELKVPTPKELERVEQGPDEALLPAVAHKLSFGKQVVYGRKKELDQFERALNGKFLKNVLLVGASGVGKTALVWEMSRRFNRKASDYQIWETTASVMIKELMRETSWQDNLAFLCKELTGSPDILFIRNLMELFEVGQYEGNSVSVADYLRPYLGRGEIMMISECTEEELAQIELRNSNYLSYFQVIRLQEPVDKLDSIILKKVKDIASLKNIFINEEAIKETIRLNRRFTPYSGMPGKPIRFLESIIINKKNEQPKGQSEGIMITRSEVIRHFADETGMPVFMIDPTIPMNTTQIKAEFNANVFGQEDAVENVVDILASVKTALTRTGKPIASFLFVGPTGVGKTELAKVLADFMFGSRERMIRFDMSEFSNPASVSRLLGSGYYSDGLLTSAVRKDPFSVLLFDEIEKADTSFYDLLLQILSEGRLTDGRGKLVNFCSTIIIMTSNIGATRMQQGGISLVQKDEVQDVLDYFSTAVQQFFRRELYNRIDRIIPFFPLDMITVRFVVEREIELLRKREGIRFRRMQLDIKEAVLDYLAEAGYSPRYGARQLQRTIREQLIIPLATALNYQDPDDQLSVIIDIADGKIDIQIEADPLGLDLLLEELDKITQADYTSLLRRNLTQIREGSFFIQLLSELERLENRKKKQKNKFWQDRKEAERYTYYLETRNNVEMLMERIEAMEEELSLACLGHEQYRPQLTDEIKAWEDDFFELKVEIYTRLHPKSNSCHIGIYGKDVLEIYNFYLELFERKAYDFIIETVWFREAYYQRHANDDMDNNAGYIKRMVGSEAVRKPFKSEKPDDLLVGVEFVISGNCAHLYLRDEDGGQKWKAKDGDEKRYHLLVENEAFTTPEQIHRKDYYNKIGYRRTMENNIIRDNRLNLNREFAKGQLLDILIERLDNDFKAALDNELF